MPETGLLWGSACIWVAFALPHPKKFPRSNFHVAWWREQCFSIPCSIKCRFGQGFAVLSSELGSLPSPLPRGGKVGKPSAPITLAGPEHPAGGLPVPRNISKMQKTAIQTTDVQPSSLVALGTHMSVAAGCRAWSPSRMSPHHRGAGTPLLCKCPKAEPWRGLMPRVVAVKDTSQGLSLFPCGTTFFSLKFYEYSFSCKIPSIAVPIRYSYKDKNPL